MVQIPQGVAEDACTLPSAERTLREQEFDQLVTVAVWAVERLGPTRFADGAGCDQRARTTLAATSEDR